jgi:hypothetical protein
VRAFNIGLWCFNDTVTRCICVWVWKGRVPFFVQQSAISFPISKYLADPLPLLNGSGNPVYLYTFCPAGPWTFAFIITGSSISTRSAREILRLCDLYFDGAMSAIFSSIQELRVEEDVSAWIVSFSFLLRRNLNIVAEEFADSKGGTTEGTKSDLESVNYSVGKQCV